MTPRKKTVKKKEVIMNIAIRLFMEQGYAATSLQQIADESETSSALIIYHYGTKDAILKEFLEQRMQEVRCILREKIDLCMEPEIFLCSFVRLWQSVMASDTFCRFYHDIINEGVFQKYFFNDKTINVSDLILQKRQEELNLSSSMYSFYSHFTLPALEFAAWISMGEAGPDDEKLDIPFRGFMSLIGVEDSVINSYLERGKKIVAEILAENPQLMRVD